MPNVLVCIVCSTKRNIYIFYYGLTFICNPMLDTLISYNRNGHMYLIRGRLVFRYTTDDKIGHLGVNEWHLVGMDQDPVPTCKAFLRSVVVLFLALYGVY